MVRQLDAIYEDGVLRPLEPLRLSERQKVRLTLDDQSISEPDRANGADASSLRQEEMSWLTTERERYAGQWVALSGHRLLAHGTDAAAVLKAARDAGVERPLLTHLAEKPELPFGGW